MTRRKGTGHAGHDVTLVIEQLRRTIPGGIGTYTRELLRGLRAIAPFEALTIGLYASRAPRGKDPLLDFSFDLRTSIFPGPLMTRLWDKGHAGFQGGGIVHALSLTTPPSSEPLVVTVHDLAFRKFPEAFTPYAREWHELAFVRAAKRARAFVVPSEEVGAALVDAGEGIRAEQVRVITEGADHLPPPDLLATEALLRRCGVEGRFILSVGTVEPRKNLLRLIDAYGRLRAELDDPPALVICGPAGWSMNLSAPEGVVFTGWVDEPILSGLYERASVVAYVPLHEGFGLPVVEAMHQGAVVVASAVPSAREGALIVDPYDPDSIANGLCQAITDETLRAELTTAATSYASTLTWEATARAHCRLWDEVLGR